MNEVFIFIVNSRIGTHKIDQLKKAISQHFENKSYQIHLTEFAGHATAITKNVLQQGYHKIIAVGGDGTVNEVLQSLAYTNCVLGIVPTGSGNGLARHLGLSLQIETAVEQLKTHTISEIDLGKMNEFFFISNAGVGFDATVCQAIKESKFRGLKMYVWEVMKHFFSYKPLQYQIEIDGETMIQQAYFLNIANGKEFGYGFQIAPEASLQDGYLDLVIIKDITFWNGFGIVWDGFRNKLKQNKHCFHVRAKKIRIQSEFIPFFQTDGDAHICKENLCEVQININALKIFAPSSFVN